MFQGLVLLVAVILAAPSFAATAPLADAQAETSVMATRGTSQVFPALLAAGTDDYRGFSEPRPPYLSVMVLQLVFLVISSLIAARPLAPPPARSPAFLSGGAGCFGNIANPLNHGP